MSSTTKATTATTAAFAINNNNNEKNGNINININKESSSFSVVINNNNNKNKNESTNNNNINWIVRKSNLDDRLKVNRLLKSSYQNLLIDDYPSNILDIVLPKICTANDNLLTCGTWYVVEHPTIPNELVGCGGWTPYSPLSKMKSLLTEEAKIDKGEDDSQQQDHNNYPHLRHFGTDPNYKRQGIAKSIWDRCWNDVQIMEYFDDGHHQPKKTKTMEVISTITAEPFYKSLGFEKIYDMSIPFGTATTTTASSTPSPLSSPDNNNKNNCCNFPCILMRREIIG